MSGGMDVLEDLTHQASVTKTANKARLVSIFIDVENKFIRIEHTRGVEDKGEYEEVFGSTLTTLEDTVDEKGVAMKTGWTDAVWGAQMYNGSLAAGSPQVNGRVIRDYFMWKLKQEGVI